MKKLIVCVLSLVLALSLAACGGKNGEVPTPTTNDGNSSYTSDGTMIPGSDPIVVCCWFAWKPKQAKEPEQGMLSTAQIETVDSLAALSKKTGMDMKELTGLPFAVEQTEYVSYWGALAEPRISAIGKARAPRTIPATTTSTPRWRPWKSPG